MAEVDRGRRRADRVDRSDTLASLDAPARLVERAPSAPHFAVDRPRLVQQMDDATTRRLTMVVGPAGSGKSVLLAQWAAATDEPSVAWLSVADGDQHGPSLTGRLRDALAQLAPSSAPSARSSEAAATLREVAANRAGILVIEDLDRLLSVALTREIGDLIEGAPDSLRFVVTSRVDPVLPLHRLRLRDEVTEIRQVDLAFDGTEARPLLSTLARQPLTAEQADVLVARTEGWAAGLQLAALSLRSRDDVTAFVEEFSGDDRHVADYFGNEVLEQLPDDVRRFLLQTSVLDPVTPATCAALTEDDEASAAARLASLSRQGLFVTPLHESRGIYRYHRLFRDLLRLQLRIEHPGLERQLLCLAGEWHRAHGAPDDAAECFIAAGAWQDLIGLMMGFGRTSTAQLRQTSLIRWFAALPEGERWANPDIALFHALAFVNVGNALAAEQQLTEIADRFELTRGQEALRLVHIAFLCQWHLPSDQAIVAAEAALDALNGCTQDDLPAIAGITAIADLRYAMDVTIGRSLLQKGDIDGARQQLAGRLADGSGVHLLFLVHGFGIAARAEAAAGNLGAAERLARQAFDAAEAGQLGADPCSADAFLTMAVVARERNDLSRAADLLDEALSRARQNRRYALLWAVDAERAQLTLAQGQPDQGLRILRDARGEGRPPAPSGVATRLRSVSAMLLLATLDPDAAERALGGSTEDAIDETSTARVLVAIDRLDIPSARKQLAAWPAGGLLRAQIDRALLNAIVDDLDGEHRSARIAIAEAIDLAELDGNVRAFCDMGAHAQRLLRRVYRSTPTSFLREVIEAPRASRAGVVDVTAGLSDQLSDRELAVLRHLPSGLSNTQLAEQLFISVNTLKTHLGHIYQKLGVGSRREAIDRADELHLL